MNKYLSSIFLVFLLFPSLTYADVDSGPVWFAVFMLGLPVLVIGIFAALSFWVHGWKKLLWGLALYILVSIVLWVILIGVVFEPKDFVEFAATWPARLLAKMF